MIQKLNQVNVSLAQLIANQVVLSMALQHLVNHQNEILVTGLWGSILLLPQLLQPHSPTSAVPPYTHGEPDLSPGPWLMRKTSGHCSLLSESPGHPFILTPISLRCAHHTPSLAPSPYAKDLAPAAPFSHLSML